LTLPPSLARPLLKICDVTQFWSPVSGGVKRYLLEKRAFLERETTHEHVLIVPGPADRTERNGRMTLREIRSPRISSAQYRLVLDPKKVEFWIQQERPDIIEAGCP